MKKPVLPKPVIENYCEGNNVDKNRKSDYFVPNQGESL